MKSQSMLRTLACTCAFFAASALAAGALAQEQKPEPAPPKPAEQPEAKPEAKPDQPKGEVKPVKTLENLQAAYAGESNAQARYEAFAKKADEEGYASVASLFRAAAKAEGVHIKAFGEQIKKLGGEPKADVAKPEVKSTKENLEAAIKGETHEAEKMYPEFGQVAASEKQLEAIKGFGLAQDAEAVHAKLYKAALENLEKLKGGDKADYFVCQVCGNIEKQAPDKCPICYTKKDKFEKVN